jgi:hypothetical protein
MCELFICVGLHGYSSDLHGEMRIFVKTSIAGEHGNECFLSYFFSLVKIDSKKKLGIYCWK